MLKRIGATILFLLAARAWCQSSTGAANPAQMETSPLISGGSFSTETEGEERSNYLSFGLAVTTGFDDNVAATGSSKPVSDFSYQIRPTVSYSKSTGRQSITFSGSPGFTFYEPSSELNRSDTSVSAGYLYRVSPHISVNASDTFARTSNSFNQPNALTGGTVSGTQPSAVQVPFAEQMSNLLTGGISYQFSLRGLIGASGSYRTLDYPNPSQAAGLGNTSESEGSAYYSNRVSERQYLGIRYAYERDITGFATGAVSPLSAGQSNVEVQSFEPFYSVFPSHSFSIAVSGGPQYIAASETGAASKTGAAVETGTTLHSTSWGSSVMAGIGWRGQRTSAALTFLRGTTGGGGIQGVYNAVGGSATVRWQASQTWTVGASGNYQDRAGALPGVFANNLGGHSYTGDAQVSRRLGQRMNVNFGYDRIHQSYAGVASIENAPDDNREYVTITYQLSRPLGR